MPALLVQALTPIYEATSKWFYLNLLRDFQEAAKDYFLRFGAFFDICVTESAVFYFFPAKVIWMTADNKTQAYSR